MHIKWLFLDIPEDVSIHNWAVYALDVPFSPLLYFMHTQIRILDIVSDLQLKIPQIKEKIIEAESIKVHINPTKLLPILSNIP